MEPLDRPGTAGPAAGGYGEWAAPDSQVADAVAPSRRPSDKLGAGGAGRGTPPDRASAPPLPVPLGPMTLSDLLDGAFRVLKSRPRTVLGIAAAILVPVFMVAAFLQRNATHGYTLGSGFSSTTTFLNNTGSDLAASYLAAALLAASLFFLGGALGRLVSAWYAGGELTAGQALRAAFRRTPALLAAFAMLLPVKILSAAACYVGIIPVVTLFSLTAPAIVVEGLGPYAGARRSCRLISRRFWPAVGTIVVATVGSSILSTILSLLPTLFALILPNPLQWIVLGLVRAAVALVVITALVSVSVLLYLDLRIRSEGLDVELGMADAFARAG